MSIEKFNNLTVFITGSCGTIGKEIIRILISETSASIIAIDNNETELFLQQEKYKSGGRVKCFLVDIRDKEALLLRMQGTDIVLHTAALKHVGICETSPAQAIQTNIIGSQNVIEASLDTNVSQVIALSTDKASSPINLYGATKLCLEKLFISANNIKGKKKINFSVVRYGNVIGSRGSVIPNFINRFRNFVNILK